jgi:hypothetical protein
MAGRTDFRHGNYRGLMWINKYGLMMEISEIGDESVHPWNSL